MNICGISEIFEKRMMCFLKRFWVLLLVLIVSTAACSVVTAVSPTPLPAHANITPTAAESLPMSTVPTSDPVELPTQFALPEPSQTPLIAALETAVSNPIPEASSAPLPTPTFAAFGITQTVGFSAEGRPIINYRFGFGTKQVVLVGGIHGGYEWNSIVMAYQAIDHFLAHPEQIPANVTLHIIPSANPDGQFAVTNTNGRFTAADVVGNVRNGRFNGNQVDLNRNWDCDWQPVATWGGQEVSGGESPFSEPETQALRRFFLGQQVDIVIFYHSKADGVYAGGCEGIYEPSLALATLYGDVSGYPVYEQFAHYEVTGDASDWLALQDIASFTVELQTRSGTDWPENRAGILAMLDFYAGR